MGKYQLADLAHHVKGEPVRYRHGWIPVGDEPIKTKLKAKEPPKPKPFPEIARSALSNPDTPRTRAVSSAEFQRLAAVGKAKLTQMRRASSEPKGLDEKWDKIVNDAWSEVGKSWGGVTIDAHTGEPITGKGYILSVKPNTMNSESVPETASRAEFEAAMARARKRFAGELSSGKAALGVFHDDDNNRIDIDPTIVVDSVGDVEQIGAYTHAVGGAYNLADGNGYWPPYVGK